MSMVFTCVKQYGEYMVIALESEFAELIADGRQSAAVAALQVRRAASLPPRRTAKNPA